MVFLVATDNRRDCAPRIHPKIVIAGLDPAIQPAGENGWVGAVSLDRRVKPGDDILRNDHGSKQLRESDHRFNQVRR